MEGSGGLPGCGRIFSQRVGCVRPAFERAELTQLVECQLPKLDVAGSNPVLRSFCFSVFGLWQVWTIRAVPGA